jgi:restriction system protein
MARKASGLSWRTIKILGGVLHDILRHHQGKLAHPAIIRKAEAAIGRHLPALVTKREQLVRRDAYGGELLDDWLSEIEYFITARIKPSLTTEEQFGLARAQPEITDLICRRVEAERERNPIFRTFSPNMSPIEFEAFCADQLCRAGWDAHVTKQSHDQGVDVVAEKDGVRVVLQCKLLSSRPVGNAAVQEALAARSYEQAAYGVVVSNQKFTRDAEQLASTTKILLIHYTELPILSDKIGIPSKRASEDARYCEDVTPEEFGKRVKANSGPWGKPYMPVAAEPKTGLTEALERLRPVARVALGRRGMFIVAIILIGLVVLEHLR